MKKIIKIMLLTMVLLFCAQVLTYAANAELTNSRGSYQRKNSYTKAYAYKTGDTVNYTFSLGASEGLIHTLSLYIRPASDENGLTNLLGTPTRLYNYDAANERTSYSGSFTLPATTAEHPYSTYVVIFQYYLRTSVNTPREFRLYIIKDSVQDQAMDTMMQFPNGRIYIRGWIMQFEPTYETRVRIYRGTTETDSNLVWSSKTTQTRQDVYNRYASYRLEKIENERFGFFLDIHQEEVTNFTIGEYTVVVDALGHAGNVIRSYKYPPGDTIPSQEAGNGYTRSGEFHIYAPRKHYFNDQQCTYTAVYGSTTQMYCTGDDIDGTTPPENDTFIWYRVEEDGAVEVGRGKTYAPPSNLAVGTYTYVCNITTTYTGKASYNSNTGAGGGGGSEFNVIKNHTGSRTSTTPNITYTVTRQPVKKPMAVARTYNGSVQYGVSPQSAATGYSYGGTTYATNAGIYAATATLGSNYMWSDATTDALSLPWEIAKLGVTVTAKDQTITYGEDIATGAAYVTHSAIATGDSLLSVTLTQSTWNATNGTPGTITPTDAVFKEGNADVTANYDITYQTGTLTVDRASVVKPTIVQNLVYNGGDQYGVAPQSAGDGYEYSGTTHAVYAGDYEATATLDSNHQWEGGETLPIMLEWSIAKKQLTPSLYAMSKSYDTTNKAVGSSVTVDGVVLGDSITADATCTFESSLPGIRQVTASDFVLQGEKSENYVVVPDSIAQSANIYPYDMGTAVCVSPYINTVKKDLMQTAIQTKISAFTLPDGAVYDYAEGQFGAVQTDYVREGEFMHALGVLTDTFSVDISLDGVVIVYGKMQVTTGTNKVYGNNKFYKNPETFMTSSILKCEGTWTNETDDSITIRTDTPTNVTFYVYLKQDESIKVGTQIGPYYGRVDVTVRQGNSELAKDKIDAFFPVNHDESYIISNMNSSVLENNINPLRGDYWSSVPAFKAPEDGLYAVGLQVTGSSYLLDATYGLGHMYQGNDPADPPKTTIASVEIVPAG